MLKLVAVYSILPAQPRNALQPSASPMLQPAQASSALRLQVTLKCGATESLSGVQEPNRCEYTAVFATPAACTPALAAAVRDRLQSWDVHDEL